MNKYDFLRKLDKELSALDITERKELLAFYEERFYTGTIYENKTEEQIIAELESPEQIASNILSEYGISRREVRKRGFGERPRRPEPKQETFERRPKPQREYKEDRRRESTFETDSRRPEPQRRPVPENRPRRSKSVNPTSLIILICVDLFILSWLIPSLFSVVVSLGGSLLSYVGVVGLVLGSYTDHEFMTFLFLTGAYYLLFLLTLAFLELFLWVIKKSVLYHLRVFKYKKYHNVSKKLSKVSVENWFKKHRFARFLKNTAGVAAVVLIIFGGTYLYSNKDEIYQTYVSDKIVTEVHTYDTEEFDFENWNIDVDAENIRIKVVETTGSEIVVTRNYVPEEDEVFEVSLDQNTLKVLREVPVQVNVFLSLEEFATLFVQDEIYIEVPSDIMLDDVDVLTSNAKVEVRSLDINILEVTTSNGKVEVAGVMVTELDLNSTNAIIDLRSVEVANTIDLYTTNGQIKFNDVIADTIIAQTTNAKVDLKDVYSNTITLESTNASIELENVYEANPESSNTSLSIVTTNGSIELAEVYLESVDLDTTNASIDFYNTDDTFEIDFEYSTSNGDYEGNVN